MSSHGGWPGCAVEVPTFLMLSPQSLHTNQVMAVHGLQPLAAQQAMVCGSASKRPGRCVDKQFVEIACSFT